MIKEFSAWNQQKFNEYMNIAQKYEMSVNTESINKVNSMLKRGSNNIYCKNALADETIFGISTSGDNYDINTNDRYDHSDSFYPKSDKTSNCAEMNYNIAGCINNNKKHLSFNPSLSSFHKYDHARQIDELTNFATPTIDLDSSEAQMKIDNADLISRDNLANQSETYTQAANNLKTFIHSLKNSKYGSFSTFSSDVRRVLDEETMTDKSSQTDFNIEIKDPVNKLNQTKKIKTKSTGILTEDFLMHKWYQDYLSNNLNKVRLVYNSSSDNFKASNIEMKSPKTTSISKKSNLCSKVALTGNQTNENQTNSFGIKHMRHFTDTKTMPIDNSTYCRKAKNLINNTKMKISNVAFENADKLSNSKYLKETIVSTTDDINALPSKSTGKFDVFNEIIENLGIKLRNTDNLFNNSEKLAVIKCPCENKSIDPSNKSFWDNPLDKIDLMFQKSSPVDMVSLKSMQNDCDFKVDHSEFNKTIDSNLPLLEKDSISTKAPSKRYIQKTSFKSDLRGNVAAGDSLKLKFSKVFYLNPYDDIIKSHFSQFDRRLKSVSAKNNSLIIIEGPLNCNEQSALYQHLNGTTVIYSCTISSNSQDNLDKCINYLKETFPNSYLKTHSKK